MNHKKIILSLIIITALITGILAITLLQPQQTPAIIPPKGTQTIQIASTPTVNNLTQETLQAWPSALQNSTNANSEVTFNVLSDPPLINITYPSEGAWLSSDNFVLTWYCSLPESDIAYYLVYVDNNIVANLSPTFNNWWINNLWDGAHTVIVTAFDSTGQPYPGGTAGVDFFILSTPPSVTITYPSNNSWLSSGTFTATWSVSPPTYYPSPTYPLDYTLVSVDGVVLANLSSGANPSYPVSGLPDGPHSVSVTAVGMSGLSGSSVVDFNVLSTPPSVTITYPSNGANLPSGTFTVTWSSSSPGLAYYNVSVDGSTPVNVGLATSYPVSPALSDGPHSVSVTAVNMVGLSGSSVVDFNVLPSVTVTSPSSGAWLSSGTFTVTWSSSSPNVAYYLVYINGTLETNVTSATTSYLVSPALSDGPYSLNVTAVDLAGLSGSDVVTFNVLSTPPTVTITYPSSGAWLSSGTFTVTWSSSSPSLAYYLVSVDGASPVNVGLATSYQVSGLSDGSHDVNVTAVNLAGLSGYSDNSFNVLSTAPSVTITYPSSGAWLSSGTFYVNWSSSSPDLAYFLVYINSTLEANVSSATNSYQVSSLPNGPYTANVTAVNLAGLSNYSVVSFNVLSTPPSVTVTSPSSGATLSSGTFNVTWSSSSPDLAYYLVSVNGSAPVNLSSATNSYQFTGLSSGSYSVNVTAVNMAGLSATNSVTFSVSIPSAAINLASALVLLSSMLQGFPTLYVAISGIAAVVIVVAGVVLVLRRR